MTVACWLVGLLPGVELARHLGFVPLLSAAEPWRALTVALVHASPAPWHLLFNMVGVFVFGGFLERALGPWRFLAVYVLSALGGSAAVLLFASPFDPDWVTLHVGASGALFGLLGVVLVPTRKLDRNVGGAVAFLLLNLVFTFVSTGVSWQSHLGGLVVGFALGCAALLPGSRSAGGAGVRGPGARGPGAPAHAVDGPRARSGGEPAAPPGGGASSVLTIANVWFWSASALLALTMLAASWPHLRAAAMLY